VTTGVAEEVVEDTVEEVLEDASVEDDGRAISDEGKAKNSIGPGVGKAPGHSS
jgi:hypothetical protein